MSLSRLLTASIVLAVASGRSTWAVVRNVPTPTYPTIQSAITASNNGDEVVVAAGTYNEAINFAGKAITVRSADGPAVTTISAVGIGDSVVRCDSGEGPNSMLEGFTLSDGTGNTTFVDPVGGGLYVFLSGPTIKRCVFSNNSAKFGGAVYSQNSAPFLQSCLFLNNTATDDGGAVYSLLSDTTVVNCTVFGNTAQATGGVLVSGNGTTVSNSILWGNSDAGGIREQAQIQFLSTSPSVAYSIIQNLATLPADPGNRGDAPQFVDAAGADFRLLEGSPAIDAGSNAAPGLPTLDLDGLPRRIDHGAVPDTGLGVPPVVDIGAFEHRGDCSGNGIPDHTEPDSDGDGRIDTCDTCPDTPAGGAGCPPIPNITRATEHLTIQAAIDAAVAGDEIVPPPARYVENLDLRGRAILLRSQDGPATTIIDATTLGGTVIRCVTGEGPDTILHGLTIKGGSAAQGGGILINGPGPTVRSCVFDGNAADFGGGVYSSNGSPRILGCTFLRNTATIAGGGLASVLASPVVIDCIFRENTAAFGGGALYGNNAAVTLSGSTLYDNNAGTFGGGILNDNSDATVSNSILWKNADAGGAQSSAQFHVLGGNASLVFSCIQGGWSGAGGAGVTSNDPQFAAPAAGDLRLQPGSPCIDAGSNLDYFSAALMLGATTDVAGAPRFTDDPDTPDGGAGFGSIIDMGAYEFQSATADFDGDGDGDLFDFARFLEMFTGPQSP